jgi:predicted transcriptional regulator
LVKAKEMILEELINAGIPVPQSTVIEVAGIARETCRRLLSEMEDEGSVKRVENKGRVYWEWACDLF